MKNKVGKSRSLQVLNMHEQGYKIPKIAKLLNIKENSARRYLRNGKILNGLSKKQQGAEILFFDIETSPITCLTWGLFKQNIPIQAIISEWAILSWSAKWLYDNEVIAEAVTPAEAKNKQDRSIIKGLWNLLNKADIIIAHNAIKFDVKKVNARFIANGLKAPMPYRAVDTLRVSRQNFAFSSHKLDHISNMMDLHGKIPTDFNLWKRCIGIGCDAKEQQKALNEMVVYNKSDVLALEDIYVAMLPFIKSHPNIGLYYSDTVKRCANCGHEKLNWKGYYYTTVGRYRTFRCLGCGSIGRSRVSELTKNDRENLIAPIAR